MTSREPYDYQSDLEFDRIASRYQETAMPKNTQPSTLEERTGQAYLLGGCAAVILALCLGVAAIITAWRVF